MMIDEVIRTREKILHGVLLCCHAARAMPAFAVPSTAARVTDGVHAVVLEPHEPRPVEIWRDRKAVSTIPFEIRRMRAVEAYVLCRDDRERDHRAVGAARLDFPRFVFVCRN